MGNRHEKYFNIVPEARNWIEDSKYADKHTGVFVATESAAKLLGHGSINTTMDRRVHITTDSMGRSIK